MKICNEQLRKLGTSVFGIFPIISVAKDIVIAKFTLQKF